MSKIKFGELLENLFIEHTVWVILIAVFLPFSFLTEGKITSTVTLSSIFVTTSILGVMCLGFSFPLMAGVMDLSPGSIACLTALFGAWLISDLPWSSRLMINPIVAMAIAIGLGFGLGFLNGLLVVKLGLNSFMATLGTMIAMRGLATYLTGGFALYALPSSYLILGDLVILGIPIPIPIFLIMCLIFHTILTRTKFGAHVLLTGDNETAALATGVNVRKTRIMCYVISGFTACISGLMLAGHIRSVGVDLAEGYTFLIFAASVIGGVSLRGGEGRISGILGGAFLLPLITTGLVFLGVSATMLDFAIGIVVIFALTIDILKRRLLLRFSR